MLQPVPSLVHGDDWPDETLLDDDAVFKSELILMYRAQILHRTCFAVCMRCAGAHFPSHESCMRMLHAEHMCLIQGADVKAARHIKI